MSTKAVKRAYDKIEKLSPTEFRNEVFEPTAVHLPKRPRKCDGCIRDVLNQLGHYGGCIPDINKGETWESCYQ